MFSRSLPSPKGFLESGPTPASSMNAGLQAHYVGAWTGKTTNFTHKWFCTRCYTARLLRPATFNVCLVALNCVGFLGLIKFNPNAAPGDIKQSEIRRNWHRGEWNITMRTLINWVISRLNPLPAGVVIARPVKFRLHPIESGKHERTFIAYFVAGSSPTNSHWSGDADLARVHFFSMHPPSIKTSNLWTSSFPAGAWKDIRKLVVVTWSIARLLGA